ncbi:pickpocket protein 28-like [Melitaea cinxia]|uniref:pickpocket protein 28-like n=1 Tax=Melitaea cinxia TaxID=113334 RepID=UPI001E270DFF|nr:pickpocket protein 28-like [Melitaea cinxia]
MERQSRSNSLGNIHISYIGKNMEPATTDNVKIKRKKPSLIKQCLIDYTANTNLHGLKYVGEKERTIMEKIFWLLMFTCCIVFCAGLIWKLWIKWNDNPVIVSFAETSTPVWKIPYPAVTLCPEMKVMQTVFNYTEHYHLQEINPNATEEQDDLFKDISLICNKNISPWIHGRNFSLGNKTVENIKKVSPKIYDIMEGLMWKDELRSFLNLFSPILTEEGYCYTFNTIGADELFRIENLNTDYNYYDSLNKSQTWTLENGYSPNTPLETYPYRGTGNGENAGLVIVLRASKKDFDYLCSGPTQGFKIILHNPAEFPKLSQQYFRIPLERDVVVAAKPKMMTTSDGLKPYSPVRRQCYFSNERYLKFFKVYTQANCESECLTNFTYTKCGCVHFGMPHGPEMKVCSLGKRQCMNDARMELVTVEIQNNLEEATNADYTLGEAYRVAINCKCLPACTSIEYEAETSQADFDVDAFFKAMNINTINEADILYTQIKIFFKEAQFIKVRRSELYGHTDFLANCGGLLGLFLGFSLLSVVEFIYFFTLRVCCILWRSGKNKNT